MNDCRMYSASKRALALYIRLASQQCLLCLPAVVIDFSMNTGREFIANQFLISRAGFIRPIVCYERGKPSIQAIVVLGDILFFKREHQNGLILEAHLRGPGLMPIGGALCYDKIGGFLCILPFLPTWLGRGRSLARSR